jgi:acetyl esterase/lipase
MSDIDTSPPITGTVLRIWPGAVPGSESWTWSEQVLDVEGGRQVRNVSTPTLEVFAAEGTATGTAVIVAPGGAHSFLMVDKEGVHLARRLAAQGVTAFVLRYRVRHTPEGDAEMRVFTADLDVRTRGTPWSAGRRAIIGEEADHAATLGMADGRQAVRYVRDHAWEWGIDPGRVGMVGFSAGGGVTMAAATAFDVYERPDFAAPIYSPQADTMVVSKNAPPLFLACAIDDPNVPPTESIAIWQAWHDAGRPAELHIFATGGHGFGATPTGHGSDPWVELYETWLRGLGLLSQPDGAGSGPDRAVP